VIESQDKRKRINDMLMSVYPNVEQVGFVDEDLAAPELMMAGGEFCGNATRSTAYKILKGQAGEILMKVSGVKNTLRAGVTEEGEAYAQMPIYPEPENIITDEQNPSNCLVVMEGIAHYLNFDTSATEGLSEDEVKEKGIAFIKERNLDTKYPASGVIYASKEGDGWRITPIVYVSSIETAFYETACGSGTTALGMALALKEGGSIENVPIIQPTGLPIKVSVEFDGLKFGYAQIQGPVEELVSGKLEEGRDHPYAIERVQSLDKLGQALDDGGLSSLYQSVFGEPPYCEEFTDADVREYFEEYTNDGMLFVARGEGNVVGFSATLPITSVPEVRDIVGEAIPNVDTCQYVADLGVDQGYRREGIGKRMVMEALNQMPDGIGVVMRTTESNIPSQNLHRALGFETVEGVYQDVEQARVDGITGIDRRIFLAKLLDD